MNWKQLIHWKTKGHREQPSLVLTEDWRLVPSPVTVQWGFGMDYEQGDSFFLDGEALRRNRDTGEFTLFVHERSAIPLYPCDPAKRAQKITQFNSFMTRIACECFDREKQGIQAQQEKDRVLAVLTWVASGFAVVVVLVVLGIMGSSGSCSIPFIG